MPRESLTALHWRNTPPPPAHFTGPHGMPAADQLLDRPTAAALLPANDESFRRRLSPACCHAAVPAVHAELTVVPRPTRSTLQVFDVASFDMIAMLRLPWVPGCVEWCFRCAGAAACKSSARRLGCRGGLVGCVATSNSCPAGVVR